MNDRILETLFGTVGQMNGAGRVTAHTELKAGDGVVYNKSNSDRYYAGFAVEVYLYAYLYLYL